jgi:esterase/lipase superfamily enzyme
MKEEYFKWYSPNLKRDIEMLVFGHSGYPVILFPTSMGSFHENKDMGLIASAKWYIEQGLIEIYCPDSVDKDSFYNKNIYLIHGTAAVKQLAVFKKANNLTKILDLITKQFTKGS